MAKELFKFSNDKKGFRLLLALESLVALWALAATLYAVRTGRTSTILYGTMTLLAIFYILGRSLRSYHNIVKKEKSESGAKKKEGESK
ncbi:MAG: hypothetical protein IJU66_08235 [Oscillospiraceae bacterium]|nr:hypothetical protein [Oscillospiraceae bacterium]